MNLAWSIALASATLISACAADGAFATEDPIALENAIADDSGGLSLTVARGVDQWFWFDCVRRCDVTLELSLDRGENPEGAPLARSTSARSGSRRAPSSRPRSGWRRT